MVESPIFWIVLAYLIAAIPVGLLVGYARGIDLREIGSGNIGATNAVRAFGKAWGLVVLALDIGKAGFPVWLARSFGGLEGRAHEHWWIAGVAMAAVCGHIFPIYLRFRGGKGVACALGTLLVLSWPSALVAFGVYVLALVRTRVSAIGSLAGITSGALAMWLFANPMPYRVVVTIMLAIIWWRHRENLSDLRMRAKPTVADAPSSESDQPARP